MASTITRKHDLHPLIIAIEYGKVKLFLN